MNGPQRARVRILDADVDLLTTAELTECVDETVRNDARMVVANHNLHSLRLLRRNPELRAFYESADLVHIDGMPLVWIARLLGLGARREHRTTYVDWLPEIVALSARRSWRLFYLGSRPGVAQAGLDRLAQRFPGFEGRSMHGYLDQGQPGHASADVIEAIRAFRPHILLVGMGMPRQELWIARHRASLAASVILPCGAAIDYVAGVVPTPPRWAGALGLEWLFRLVAEPRRLAHRYLIEPWALAIPLLRAFFRTATNRRG